MENLRAPGRIYFHVLGSSELLAAARSVEMMGVLLLRHSDDPLGATGCHWVPLGASGVDGGFSKKAVMGQIYSNMINLIMMYLMDFLRS